VDDDESFLRSVTRLLRARGFAVVPHASADDFLNGFRPHTSGCVVTDLRMPGMDGLGLQEALHRAGSSLPVVFFTGQGEIPAAVRAMRGGAEDFLTKDAPQDDLVAAVNRALRRNEEDRARHASGIAFREKFDLLTDREREILRHVVSGRLNKQIAADLGIHERTVKLHRTNLTRKLCTHSVAELTRKVEKAGVFA
jgi:FixJ family two-component response regulator